VKFDLKSGLARKGWIFRNSEETFCQVLRRNIGAWRRAGLINPAFTFAFRADTIKTVPAAGRVRVGPFLVYFACAATTRADVPPGFASPVAENEVNDYNHSHENYKDNTGWVHFVRLFPRL
jgi:hypothetical protein